MKTCILSLLLVISSAYAGDRTNGLKIICLPMKTQPEFYNCIATLRQFQYFNEDALIICATMNTNTQKIDCMESIGDAAFNKDETNLCAVLTVDSDKQDCLNSHGTVYEP